MATRTQRERRDSRYTDARQVEKSRKVFSKASLNLPGGVELFRPKKDETYKFDVLAYVVGEGNPAEGVKKGKLHYERTYFSHGFVGPASGTFCCLAKNWNEKCPVCQWLDNEHAKAEADEDQGRAKARHAALAKMKPKQRQLWNIVLVQIGDGEPKPRNKVMVYDESYFLFGEKLKAKIMAAEADDNYPNFFHLEDGMTLTVTYEEKSIGASGKCINCSNIEMKARKPYGDEWLDKVVCLDDVPVRLPYDQLKDSLYGAIAPEEENGQAVSKESSDSGWEAPARERPVAEKPPARRAEPEPEPEPETPANKDATAEELGIEVGMTVEHPQYGDCTVTHVSGDGTSLRLENARGKEIRAVDPADCKPLDDVPADDAPPARKAPGPRQGTATKPPARKAREEPEPEPADESGVDPDAWDADDIPFDDEPAEGEKPQRRR